MPSPRFSAGDLLVDPAFGQQLQHALLLRGARTIRRADGRPVGFSPLRSPGGENSTFAQLPTGAGLRRDELHRYRLPADLVGEPITVEVIGLIPLRAEFTVASPKLP